ncbi:uncharacterized protein EV154DRAFT_593766 [Mucor mucedo]|uniref:uncharacterized protein n=1 Tax=Mucor mucedo TaxID=29922 RepID=UPI00221E8389|nr:uncharacterized protein EV154DRAFT_593766 [Mucor mucedo]KAI7888480.1 hypothetical protein EV154DRAFT_593766 [Mucor mucedo]
MLFKALFQYPGFHRLLFNAKPYHVEDLRQRGSLFEVKLLKEVFDNNFVNNHCCLLLTFKTNFWAFCHVLGLKIFRLAFEQVVQSSCLFSHPTPFFFSFPYAQFRVKAAVSLYEVVCVGLWSRIFGMLLYRDRDADGVFNKHSQIWLRKYMCEQIVVSSSTTSLKVTDNHKEPPLRTCSSPSSPLLRSDLPLDIKQEFLDRIRDATISAFLVVCMRFIILTYKIYHSQVQPSSISATRPISQRSETGEIKDIRCLFKSHKCILVFKKATFVIDRNNNTSLEIKKGPLASDILIKVYHVECSEICLPPPLDHSLFSSTSSSRQLLQLFNFETENRINNRSRHGGCTLVFLLIFFGIR